MNYMNWEELVKARDDQTPLVWCCRDHNLIVVTAAPHLSPHGRGWVRLPDDVPDPENYITASTDDLRIATAQDLLELGDTP